MKRTFAIFLSIAALLLAAAPLAGQEYPYKGGEKLSYTVHYKCGISADLAYVDLACTEDASSFSVKANVATYKFWDTFFKMRDTFETKFAKTGNRPISYHRDVTEGGYWAKNWLTWSADASQYRSITEKKTRPRRDTVYRESEIVYDVINLIYKVRGEKFEKLSSGKPVHYLHVVDRDIFDCTVRAVGREQKKVAKTGTFNTVKLAIAIVPHNVSEPADDDSELRVGADSNGDFTGEEKVFFWVTDDENHLPVFFSTSLNLGSIQGRLSSYEGLKHPLTSKTE